MSVNYADGLPLNFERVEASGMHQPFSSVKGLTDEIKIATARSKKFGEVATRFVAGDLFVGNGNDGEIVRISSGGAAVVNPWVSLPGDNNGLLRGSLYVDRTGVFGGDLIAVTTAGEVWRVTAAGAPTLVTKLGVHLEGLIVVPNYPARYGPLAGKILAGAEEQSMLHAIAPDGKTTDYLLGVAPEDIDLISPNENFFAVEFGNKHLLGAPASEFVKLQGDILIGQEMVSPGTSGLYVLRWDGSDVKALPVTVAAGSPPISQWEHMTFAPAGVAEVTPIN
jgi:hypothetical protein